MASEGYESASLGLWGWICTLQAIIGLLCFAMSNNLSPYEEVAKVPPYTISRVDASNFSVLASAAIASALIIILCSFLSYMVIPRLSNLLMGLAGLLTLAASLAAAIIMGIIITETVSCLNNKWDYMHHPVGTAPHCDYTVNFGYEMKPALAGIGVAAVVSVALTLRALVMRPSATALDGILYSSCLAVAAAIIACTTLQKAAVPPLLVLGILWIVGTVLLLTLLQQQKVCWPRFTSIVLALLSAVLALLGLITASVCAKIYANKKVFLFLVHASTLPYLMESLSGDPLEDLKITLRSSMNYDYLVTAALGASAALGFAASALASFRAVLGPSPAEKEMAQESAEEALEGRGEA